MVRGALLIVLALAGGAHDVAAQRLTCSTIRPGDTASRAALRLTGDAAHRHREWFQVIDPATGTVVAKSRYDRIQAGWHACVTRAALDERSIRGLRRPAVTAATGPWGVLANTLRRGDVAVMLWAAVVIAAACLWNGFDEYYTARRRTLVAMTQFGERFVREFERPLREPAAATRPIRSHVKARPDRSRLDVLLAPGGGRRYPNLTDHKTNVAYDIGRVLRALADRRFVCAGPYTRGVWVVVPFRYQEHSTQAGGS